MPAITYFDRTIVARKFLSRFFEIQQYMEREDKQGDVELTEVAKEYLSIVNELQATIQHEKHIEARIRHIMYRNKLALALVIAAACIEALIALYDMFN